MGIIYHIIVKDSFAVYFKEGETMNLQQGDDNYVDVSRKIFHWEAFWGIVIRGLNHMLLICMTFVSFKYATLAQINQGVIASLFTSGVIFTSVLFYFIY